MPMSTPHDDRLGTILEGAYRITRLLREGGMGAVYEAIQLRLNKRVAIKLMACRLAANNDALTRFRREAEITSHLGHPNVVNVIDFGTSHAGEPYLVMEYLEGEDLETRLARCRTLPVPLAVHIVKQIASALAAAHAQGVVHRDLKPANVFLVSVPDEMEFVKVLDFGVSKVKAAGLKLTKVAVALGTPTYMSPEQAAGRGDEIDHFSDQWALACIAWEMLAGRGPFAADDVNALFYQIMNLQPPSLLLQVPMLDPEAELVLLRALAKSPRARFPSIREFAQAFEIAALGRAADVTPLPAVLPSPPSLASAPVGLAPQAPQVQAPKLKQLTTFSRTTGEITEIVPQPLRMSLRPRYAFALLGALLAAVLAIQLTRSSTPSAAASLESPAVRAVVRPTLTPPPSIVPLASSPEPEASAMSADVAKTLPARSKVKRGRLTAADPSDRAPIRRGVKRRASPGVSPLQPPIKRTIIREL